MEPIINESGVITKEQYDSLKGLPGFSGIVCHGSEVYDGDLVDAFYPKIRPGSKVKILETRYPKNALSKMMER